MDTTLYYGRHSILWTRLYIMDSSLYYRHHSILRTPLYNMDISMIWTSLYIMDFTECFLIWAPFCVKWTPF